ncbi:hypothetical protein QR680_019358 [Steinernema hermaphroditum]|uniref:Uncharacterized protein n=1 Tax=Steinernema hermaphroditum TaxID=289476 RepID=A0AA39GPM6_9BILA|nr:hypothetical protein QR680_019358 [Steinernema hermaphroditum]
MQNSVSVGNLMSLLAKENYTEQEQMELKSLYGSYAYENRTDRLYYSIYIGLNLEQCCIDYTISLGPMAAIVEKPVPIDYLTAIKKVCCAEIRIEVNSRRMTPLTPEDADKMAMLLANNPESLKNFMLFDTLPMCSYLTNMIRSIRSMEKICLHVKTLVPESIDWEAFFCHHWRQNMAEANLILEDVVNPEDIHNSLGELMTGEKFKGVTVKFGETETARKVRDDFFLNILCYWHSSEFVDYMNKSHFAELWVSPSMFEDLNNRFLQPGDRNKPYLVHPKGMTHFLYIRPCHASVCDYAFRILFDDEDHLYIKSVLTG